jgi:energy-coupling factor transport system ATP-binding protein
VIRLEAVSAVLPRQEPDPPREILHGLDTTFSAGESHLILGRNGSGKSTLVRILVGLAPAFAGRVLWDGEPIRGEEPLWPRLAVLLEEPDPQLLTDSVEAEVAFGLESLPISPDEVERRVSDALDAFGLRGLESRPPRELSAGEKARVLLAAAQAAEPRALLLDQTLAHLDPATRRSLEKRLVEEMAGEGRLFIRTHQGEDAPGDRDHLQILHEGRLLDAKRLDPSEILSLCDVALPLGLRVSASLAARGLLDRPLVADLDGLRSALGKVETRSEGEKVEPVARGRGAATPSGTPLLTASEVSWTPGRSRSAQPVVAGLDLELRGGEVVALIGRSGAGKTTALRLLAGLLDPTKGSIQSGAVSGPHDRVALAMEYPERQLFGRTVGEDVGLSLWVRGVASIERRERARLAMARVGLAPDLFEERPPLSLSEGEKRRAALASILVDPPPVLLLDEPTAGLDPGGKRSLAEAIDAARDQGRAILFASHDLDFVSRVADRALVIGATREGAPSILGQGTPIDLWHDSKLLERAGLPAPDFVAIEGLLRGRGLLGSSEVRDGASLLAALLEPDQSRTSARASLIG